MIINLFGKFYRYYDDFYNKKVEHFSFLPTVECVSRQPLFHPLLDSIIGNAEKPKIFDTPVRHDVLEPGCVIIQMDTLKKTLRIWGLYKKITERSSQKMRFVGNDGSWMAYGKNSIDVEYHDCLGQKSPHGGPCCKFSHKVVDNLTREEQKIIMTLDECHGGCRE